MTAPRPESDRPGCVSGCAPLAVFALGLPWALFALLLVLTSCTSSRGGLPASLQVQGSGLLAAGYDGRTVAVAFDGAGSAALVESESGIPLWTPVTWDGAGLYVRVRGGVEERFAAEAGSAPGVVMVRVPAELAPLLQLLPPATWLHVELVEQVAP